MTTCLKGFFCVFQSGLLDYKTVATRIYGPKRKKGQTVRRTQTRIIFNANFPPPPPPPPQSALAFLAKAKCNLKHYAVCSLYAHISLPFLPEIYYTDGHWSAVFAYFRNAAFNWPCPCGPSLNEMAAFRHATTTELCHVCRGYAPCLSCEGIKMKYTLKICNPGKNSLKEVLCNKMSLKSVFGWSLSCSNAICTWGRL